MGVCLLPLCGNTHQNDGIAGRRNASLKGAGENFPEEKFSRYFESLPKEEFTENANNINNLLAVHLFYIMTFEPRENHTTCLTSPRLVLWLPMLY